MGCQDCARSAAELWGGFSSGCKGCQARAAARSPWYFESKKQGAMTPEYERLLQAVGLTNEEVFAAKRADYMTKKGKV